MTVVLLAVFAFGACKVDKTPDWEKFKFWEQWQKDKNTDADTGDDDVLPVAIGENGNWYINGVDSGVPAQGPAGQDGQDGQQGLVGLTGPQGDIGATGAAGLPEITVYDIAVAGNAALSSITKIETTNFSGVIQIHNYNGGANFFGFTYQSQVCSKIELICKNGTHQFSRYWTAAATPVVGQVSGVSIPINSILGQITNATPVNMNGLVIMIGSTTLS